MTKTPPPAPLEALTGASRQALAWYHQQAAKARADAAWHVALAEGRVRSFDNHVLTVKQAHAEAERLEQLARAWDRLAGELEAFAASQHVLLDDDQGTLL